MKLVIMTTQGNVQGVVNRLAKKLTDAGLVKEEGQGKSGNLVRLTYTSRYQGITHEADRMLYVLENTEKAIRVVEKPAVI